MAADLAQLEQGVQDREVAAGQAPLLHGGEDAPAADLQHLLVKPPLGRGQLAGKHRFHPGRKVCGHLFLGSAQDEGVDAPTQGLETTRVALLPDGSGVALYELLVAAQEAR